jgi:hypothetical protein
LTRIGEKTQRFRFGDACLTEHRRLMPFFVMLLLAAALGGGAFAASVRAQVDRTLVQVGDSVGLEVVVSDSEGANLVAQIPAVNGLDIRRSSSGVRIVNGRRTDILNYVVTPTREGKFVLPPITVQVGGQPFQTNQVVLTASRSSEDNTMRLTASVSKTECYVLEPVDVTFKWYSTSQVQEPQLRIPLLQEKEELSLKSLSPVPPTQVTIEELQGTQYQVRTLVFRMYPPKAGPYTVAAATIVGEVQSGYRIATDDFFMIQRRVPNYRRVFAASDPIQLVVKELPEEGKPAGFSGAVGKYRVSLATENVRVKVGDPILLKLSVSGTGLLEKLQRPLLSKEPAFARDFLVNESLAPGDISGDRITFEQTIRAKSDSIKEIPSVSFPFFDPVRGAYSTARSQPIALTVLPTTEVTSDDVIRFGPTASQGETVQLQERSGGILANYNHLDALHNQTLRWPLLGFLAFPPLLYLTVFAVVSRRRKLADDLALARSKAAKKVLKRYMTEARECLSAGELRFYDALAKAVSRFTSDKLNLGAGELTSLDVQMLAQQERIDEETAREIADLLSQCDAGRFAPSAQTADDRRKLLEQAEEFLKNLGRKL